MSRRRRSRAWRILGALVVALLAPPLLLGLAVLLLQLGPLRSRALSAAVSAVNRSGALRGALSVGALEGDLLGGLRLRDVALRDAEGQVAVAARRVDLRYELRGLRGLRGSQGRPRRLEVAALRLSGVTVRARHLADGTLNLASLVSASPPSPPAPPGAALAVAIGEVRIDGGVRYEGGPGALPAGFPLQDAQAAVRLAGAVALGEDDDAGALSVALASATIELAAPLRARLEARGDVRSGAGGLWAHGLRLALETSGEELDRLRRPSSAAPPGLRGPLRATLAVEGPGAALGAALRLQPPRGAVMVDGRVDLPALLRGDPDAFRGTVRAEGLDAAAAWQGAPRTDLELEATVAGGARAARVELERLVLRAGGARALLRGSATTGGALEAWLSVEAPDLSSVGGGGLPALSRLAGRLSVEAQLRRSRGGPLRARGKVRGASLAASGTSVAELAIDLDTEDAERGEARLLARGVRGAGGALDEISLHLRGSRRAAQLELKARAPGAALALAARATPRRAPASDDLVGFDATIDRLDIGALGQALRLEAPARIGFQRGELLSIDGLALGAGRQRLRIDGGYDLRAGEVRLQADAERLDLGALGAVLAPGLPVPGTSLQARVRVVGPLPAPLVDVEVRGTSAAVPAIGFGAGRHELVARSYRDGVWAELTSTFAPSPAPGADRPRPNEQSNTQPNGQPNRQQAAGPRVSLRADVPYAEAAPLFGKLVLERLPMAPLRRALPPGAADLSGEARVEIVAEGSRAQPQLGATLTVPRLTVGLVHDGRGEARLRYDGADLLVALSVEAGQADRPAGRAELQFQAPVGPALLLRRPERRAALLSAPVEAKLRVTGVDLRRLPLRQLGLRSPPEAGVIDASAELSGTVRTPSLAGRVSARGLLLGPPGMGGFGLDVDLRLRYQDGLARAEASLDQLPAKGGAVRPLLRAEGEAAIAVATLLGPALGAAAGPAHAPAPPPPAPAPGPVPASAAGGGLAALGGTPIHLDLRLPGYDLSALEATEGRVSGRLTVRGTLARPEGEASLSLERLRFDERDVGDLRLDLGGAFDGAALGLRATLRQGRGGDLQLQARLPVDPDRPIEGTLRARRLDLSGLPALLPQLESLEAHLDGEIRALGSRRAPRLAGTLRAQGAALRLDGSPFAYQGLSLELVSTDGRELVVRAQARSRGGSVADRIALLAQGAREGSLSATVRVGFDRDVAQRVDGTLEARSFPLWAAGASAWLDTRTRLALEREGGTLAGELTMQEGSLRVTRTESQEGVARAEPLRDVVFVDAEAVARRRALAEAAAAAAAAPAPADPGTRLRLRARLPQPFYLRGPEVDAELSGRVDAELGDGQLQLLGAVRAGRGWIEISGQRYTISRAGASFDGSADLDPVVDVRLEREIKGARLVIAVSGKASAPRLSLSAEPPVYDEAQLMAMILAGGSGDDDAGRPADQRVLGAVSNAVSGAIVGQLKKRLGAYLPIEVLKLDLGFQGVTRVQPRLEVGKYITRRIYLSYVYQFGAQAGARRSNTHEARLDLSILRNLSLVTLFGDAAVGAVKLYWTRRF